MKSKCWDLSDLCKQGITNSYGLIGTRGWSALKNLRTDGQYLVSLPVETTTIIASSIPFTRGLLDYYVLSTGIFKQGTGSIKSYTFSGRVKIVDLIDVTWIQDSVKTIFLDSLGNYEVNPSGNTIPIANDICVLNGQIIAAGIKSGLGSLGEGAVAWSAIGSDKFAITKSNDAGNDNPNIGNILACLPLQDSGILLGTRGACQMYYAGHIFGFRDLDVPLIAGVGLCASSKNAAVYVSKSGDIIKIDKDGNFVNLGYGWLGNTVSDVKYFAGRNVFAFTTSSNTYLLDAKGLYSYGHKIYGEFNNGLVVNTGFEQSTWGFTLCPWDFGIAGLKTITEVYVRDGMPLNYRAVTATDGAAHSTAGISLNSMGSCKVVLAGDVLSLSYIAAISFDYPSVVPRISNFQVETLKLDKRFGAGGMPYGGSGVN